MHRGSHTLRVSDRGGSDTLRVYDRGGSDTLKVYDRGGSDTLRVLTLVLKECLRTDSLQELILGLQLLDVGLLLFEPLRKQELMS